MRRSITYAAALALNNNDPQLCIDLISNTKQQNYVTIRNLKVLALAKLGRLEDALAILRASLEYDVPAEGRKRSFSKTTVRFCVIDLSTIVLILPFSYRLRPSVRLWRSPIIKNPKLSLTGSSKIWQTSKWLKTRWSICAIYLVYCFNLRLFYFIRLWKFYLICRLKN